MHTPSIGRWEREIAPRQVNVVGRRNHGKTTLVVDLVEHLTSLGLRVGTLKHSSHLHLLEPPGKDSSRHRNAGASPSAIVTPNLTALYLTIDGPDALDTLAPAYAACDLVIVEGLASSPHPRKIEVWREGLETVPLATELGGIVALVSDTPSPVPLDLPRWRRSEIAEVARGVLGLVGLGQGSLPPTQIHRT